MTALDLRAALVDLSKAVSVLWNTYASDEMEGLDAEWVAVGKADEAARALLSSPADPVKPDWQAQWKARAQAAESALGEARDDLQLARAEGEALYEDWAESRAARDALERDAGRWSALYDAERSSKEFNLQAAADSDKALRAALRVVGFFASVIKSGEPWTETCEAEMRALLSAPPAPATQDETAPTPTEKET